MTPLYLGFVFIFQHIGCDFVIDSAAKEDLCGVCHGDGTTCTTIKAEFTESKGLGLFHRLFR